MSPSPSVDNRLLAEIKLLIQSAKQRAEYGKQVIENPACDLSLAFCEGSKCNCTIRL
jgi:hypothetical protein